MDLMSNTAGLVTGRSRIYVSGYERKDTNSGFHEMPWWSTDQVSLALIRNDSSNATALKTMNYLAKDGSNKLSDISFTNS